MYTSTPPLRLPVSLFSPLGAGVGANQQQIYACVIPARLESMHKTLQELQLSMQVYVASWHAMCQASRAIAEGLEKLANGASGRESIDGEGVNSDGKADTVASPLGEMVSHCRNELWGCRIRNGREMGSSLWLWVRLWGGTGARNIMVVN